MNKQYKGEKTYFLLPDDFPKRDPRWVWGFTLIELLVVLAITTLLSGILIIYNHTSRQQIALRVEEARIVEIISRAKSLSLATYREPSNSSVCGYGIHIDYHIMTYTLFRYARGSVSSCEEITGVDRDLEQTVSTFSLGNQLIFAAAPSNGGRKIDDLVFIPPNPTTFIQSGEAGVANGSGSITMQIQDSTLEATITVNAAGQITF